MRVFVSAAHTYIGRHLVRELAADASDEESVVSILGTAQGPALSADKVASKALKDVLPLGARDAPKLAASCDVIYLNLVDAPAEAAEIMQGTPQRVTGQS